MKYIERGNDRGAGVNKGASGEGVGVEGGGAILYSNIYNTVVNI